MGLIDMVVTYLHLRLVDLHIIWFDFLLCCCEVLRVGWALGCFDFVFCSLIVFILLLGVYFCWFDLNVCLNLGLGMCLDFKFRRFCVLYLNFGYLFYVGFGLDLDLMLYSW